MIAAVPELETLLAALGGLVLGAGISAYISMQRDRKTARERLDLETKLRRVVVPVLERRADTLGIPPAERGRDADGPVALTMTLASAIRQEEESGELPFGDTVEVSRSELKAETDGEETETE